MFYISAAVSSFSSFFSTTVEAVADPSPSSPAASGGAGTGDASSSEATSSKVSGIADPIFCSALSHSTVSKALTLRASEVKTIHDRIESVAYEAMLEAVHDLSLRGDYLTADQSGRLLRHIKMKAHQEMFKPGGYIDQRGKLLDPSQVALVIRNVGRIVHDRDTKLTFASYSSLTDLLLAMDDHNTMVKEILLASWFADEHFRDPEHHHLTAIKASIDFYSLLSATVGFDVEAALKERKHFWNCYFPGAREDGVGKSEKFLDILHVRQILGEGVTRIDTREKRLYLHVRLESASARTLEIDDLAQPLVRHLTSEEQRLLLAERAAGSHIKRASSALPALLPRPDITVAEVLTAYFPDLMKPKREGLRSSGRVEFF